MKNAFWIVVVLAAIFTRPALAIECCPLPSSTEQFVMPPETPPATVALEQQVREGWNFLYNPFVFTLNIVNTFGAYDQSTGATWTTQTIWMFNNTTGKWQFWSPQLTAEENITYAQRKGYEVAEQIRPGEGFWLNSRYNTSLPRIVGEKFVRTLEDNAALPVGWNMIGGSGTLRQFNLAASQTPVSQCLITVNFTTLWAWDTNGLKWIFYAPSLEAKGGSASSDYVGSHGYEDGTWWWIEYVGIWVNKPEFQSEPLQKSDCEAKG